MESDNELRDSSADMSDSDASSSLLGRGRDPSLPRPVPRFVFAVYLAVMTLHSFVFFSLWSQLVAFVRDYYVLRPHETDPKFIVPTLAAQIFMLVVYMAPVFTGVVSDVRHSRYHVIFVSLLFKTGGIGLTIVLTYFVDYIPIEHGIRGVIVGVMMFVLASSCGASLTSLLVFGIEQLDDDKDDKKRQSFRRLVFWFLQFGHLLASLLPIWLQYYVHRKLLGIGIVLIASALMLPLFVICKRFYRFNKPNGSGTLKMFGRVLGIIKGDDDDDDDDFWSYAGDISEQQQAEDADLLIQYRRVILRRYGLLMIIYFTFGSFYACRYFAAIAYPFQDWYFDSYPYFNAIFNSCPMLVFIPISDLVIKKFGFYGSKANFYFIGLAMILAMTSIAMSRFHANSEVITIAKVLVTGLSQYFFFPFGYDLCDTEAPRELRGTSTGLFLGLGTLFGSLVYIIWLFCYPQGVTLTSEEKWSAARIVVSLIMVFTIIAYIATSYLYMKAKKDSRKARESVASRYHVPTINHGVVARVGHD